MKEKHIYDRLQRKVRPYYLRDLARNPPDAFSYRRSTRDACRRCRRIFNKPWVTLAMVGLPIVLCIVLGMPLRFASLVSRCATGICAWHSATLPESLLPILSTVQALGLVASTVLGIHFVEHHPPGLRPQFMVRGALVRASLNGAMAMPVLAAVVSLFVLLAILTLSANGLRTAAALGSVWGALVCLDIHLARVCRRISLSFFWLITPILIGFFSLTVFAKHPEALFRYMTACNPVSWLNDLAWHAAHGQGGGILIVAICMSLVVVSMVLRRVTRRRSFLGLLLTRYPPSEQPNRDRLDTSNKPPTLQMLRRLIRPIPRQLSDWVWPPSLRYCGRLLFVFTAVFFACCGMMIAMDRWVVRLGLDIDGRKIFAHLGLAMALAPLLAWEVAGWTVNLDQCILSTRPITPRAFWVRSQVAWLVRLPSACLFPLIGCIALVWFGTVEANSAIAAFGGALMAIFPLQNIAVAIIVMSMACGYLSHRASAIVGRFLSIAFAYALLFGAIAVIGFVDRVSWHLVVALNVLAFLSLTAANWAWHAWGVKAPNWQRVPLSS